MESAAQSIVSKVGQVLVDELQEIRGVGKKVIHLRDELATMNALLRVISEAEQGSVDHLVEEWEKQVHDLAYDAEDSINIYSLGISRPTPPRPAAGAPVTFWARYLLARAKRIARYPYEKLVLQRALATDIKALLDDTTIVSERRARYGIDRAALRRAACFAPLSAVSVSENDFRRADDPVQFVGITKLANALARKIKAPAHDEDDKTSGDVHYQDYQIKVPVHDEDDKSLKVFSIVGLGGIGKTTLAMELCQQLHADFPCQALVSVSRSFNVRNGMKGLLLRVLQQILKEKAEEAQIDKMNVENLISKTKGLLHHKRYLIVIDDVWDLRTWEAIHSILPENNCSSRIIVTTRMEAVAKAASAYFVHHMNPLHQAAAWKLLFKRVFDSTMEGTYPHGLEKYVNKILKNSGGLPLAIVIIANLLTSYRSAEGTDIWERVSGLIGSLMENHPTIEGVRRLITLSYDYLPHHLKVCMMYMSIFPHNYVIAKDRLLYRWIAEGLVIEKQGMTLFEVAEEYFDELTCRNMIQLHKFLSWGVEVEGCRVHDMITEVMVSKSQESNFVTLVGRQYRGTPNRHSKVRRLSIHGDDHDDQHHARHGVEAMKLHHLRSLTTFQENYSLEKLLDCLGKFKLLRVLDLEDCEALQDKHMRDVCQLYLLGFLSLRGTNVKVMPDKVGNLGHLEILDVKNTFIEKLPRTVTKLSKLMSLKSNDWLLPRGLGNMKALREVDSGVLIGDNVEVAKEIGELSQLQVLSIEIRNKSELKEEFLCALASSLSKTCALQSLHLECLSGSLDFLRDVSPPPLLQCLSVYGRISPLPDWISSLTHLTKFELGWTELNGDQLFGVLCKLPNLQSVKLVGIECKDGELVARPEHSFPVLRILEMDRCPTMLTFEKGSMTKLERIVGFENLKSLKEVKLRGWERNSAMERAVEQLKARYIESNQIKVVVDWW